MNWTLSKIAVLDFEGEVSSGVVEFGVVVIKGSQIISTKTEQCRPTGQLNVKKIGIHGLRHNDLMVLDSFRNKQEFFIELRNSVDLFCAHHASVEKNLLKNAWPYRPIRSENQNLDWGPWADTLCLYKKLYPDIADYSLANLIATFGLNDELEKKALTACPEGRKNYHCALYDTLASALLLTRLAGNQKVSEASLNWLIESSASGHKKKASLAQKSFFDR